MNICHLTSVHSRYDTRIFLKECRSLLQAGHRVSLVVADGRGDEVKDRVSIIDVGRSRGRIDRVWRTTRRVLHAAVMQAADVYHFHDPELIPVGLRLRKSGRKVIFDAHEDVPQQLRSKPYLAAPARWLLPRIYIPYENWACRRFDVIVAATPSIRDKFSAIHPNSIDINNYPIPNELAPGSSDWTEKRKDVCFIGGITAIRGIKEVVQAMELVRCGARFQLAGRFSEPAFEQEVKSCPGWSNVDHLGVIDRAGVRDVLGRAAAGLVTFLGVPNHLHAQPNKMFEYMSAGIPVIASHFPLWRKIIEDNQCGICVDPADPQAIAAAIDRLATDSELARRMGENGKRAVQERYNWCIEEIKLINLYNNLNSSRHS